MPLSLFPYERLFRLREHTLTHSSPVGFKCFLGMLVFFSLFGIFPCYHLCFTSELLKGTVHPEIILSLFIFTHRHVFPNPHDLSFLTWSTNGRISLRISMLLFFPKMCQKQLFYEVM